MKLLIIILSITILSSGGIAYSQADLIPSWIKGVAEFWVEGKITDTEFIKALEFLINSDIIKVSDTRVLELEKETIYYSFKDVPSLPDKQIPVDALKKAIKMWGANNPNLEFIQSENSYIEIKWQMYPSPTHIGLATCTSMFGVADHCTLDISVGNNDCNDNFIQSDENMVANILMHEIGHALGLGHTSEEGHLMYSTESPQISYDTKGYVIPDELDESFVGQDVLFQQEEQINADYDLLDVQISNERLEYDEYYKQYEPYEGRDLPSPDYEKAQELFSKLNSKSDKLNELIDQQNQLVGKLNETLTLLDCYPNFEFLS